MKIKVEDQLKQRIADKGFSIKSFSEKIGVPYTTVLGALNNGIKKSSVDTVIKIAEGLGVSVDALGEGKLVPNINIQFLNYAKKLEKETKEEDIPYTGPEVLDYTPVPLPYLLDRYEEYKLKDPNIDFVEVVYAETLRLVNKTKEDIEREKETRYKTGIYKYPYIEESVSAGVPLAIEGVQKLPQIAIPAVLLGKYAGRKDIIVMEVNGDSMDQVIPDRSHIALISNITLKDLKDGDIVVFEHNGTYSLKHYFNLNDEEVLFRPNSSNIQHRDMIIKKDNNLTITGKVIMYNVVLN